jgi:hypothetical protein
MGSLSLRRTSPPCVGLVPLSGYKSHHHDKVKARIHFILTPDPLHTYKKCLKAFNHGWQPYCHNTIQYHHSKRRWASSRLSWECRRHVADMSARHSDVGGLRQKRHVAATQDMKKETPTYPIHVNNSRQVQVSSNIRVSYPTIEFSCLSSKSNHVIADI